jgi:hypothetical protein
LRWRLRLRTRRGWLGQGLPAGTAQSRGEHPARVAVEHDRRVGATSGTTEIDVPVSVPIQINVSRLIDDDTAGARVLRGDVHRLLRR